MENAENTVNEQLENVVDDSATQHELAPNDENVTENVIDESNNDEKSLEDLPIPEPDIEEAKVKKELPEWMKKKIDRERREAKEKSEEAQRLREELERVKGTKTQESIPQNIQNNHFPQKDDYDTETEYLFAVADYRDNLKAQQYQQIQQKQALEHAEKEFKKKLDITIDKGEEKYTDFKDLTDPILYGEFPTNRAMAEAIFESEFGDDILYFMGKYPEEAKKIALMNPVKAVKEVARIEGRFAAKKRSGVSKAPAPLTPINSSQGKASYGDPGKMSQSEFNSWYASKYGR